MAAQQPKIDIKRRQVAEAACRVIQRGGVEAANLRAIAAEMGATTGLLTRYFPGKRELLMCVLARPTGILSRHLQSATAAQTGMALVRAGVRGALPLDDERLLAWSVWAAFLGLIAGDAELAALHRQFPDALRQLLIQGLRQAQHDGQLAAQVYPAHAADALLAQITGAAVRAASDPQHYPRAKIEAVAAGAFAAILGHAAHNPPAN